MMRKGKPIAHGRSRVFYQQLALLQLLEFRQNAGARATFVGRQPCSELFGWFAFEQLGPDLLLGMLQRVTKWPVRKQDGHRMKHDLSQLFQRAPQLEPATAVSSPHPLRGCSRRPRSGSLQLDL